MTSTNLNYGTNKAETKLEGKVAKIVVAKTFVTPSECDTMSVVESL